MIGAYIMPDRTQRTAADDPRMARLRAAWPRWEYHSHPDGALATPAGDMPAVDLDEASAMLCADGLRYVPPVALPDLGRLDRGDVPGAAYARLRLRRVGQVRVPLGVGPCYAIGPRRGEPSSSFGQLLWSLYDRVAEGQLGADDQADFDHMIFLAFRQTYAVTEELWQLMAPYDDDEEVAIWDAIHGLDPKPKPDAAPTSRPAPSGS